MHVRVDAKIKEDFPNLLILTALIKGLEIKKKDARLESLKMKVINEVKDKYNITSLKDLPTIRLYRNFFWKIGIDPTKRRPAAEALIRRILSGSGLPRINTFVDSLNLASIKSEVPIASFDVDKIFGKPVLRYAVEGEKFYGIGIKEPVSLKGREIVISDNKGIIAIYPYRDSERTKITEDTYNALLIFCGVPGISLDKLQEARDITIRLVGEFCGGVVALEN
ncbi:hypothetical protein J7L29_06295 [Candidatus Bathyarchaeota archaeon]|nr:hypothetical protein [Candidatus Bathyarchaeota archaeon]